MAARQAGAAKVSRRAWLAVLAVALLGSGVASAQGVSVQSDGVAHRSGTLNLTIAVEDPEEHSFDVDVLIDGRPLERQSLGVGSHSLRLEAGRLTSGRHAVEVRAGTASATTEILVLPGWFSILPPVVAITLALIFRNVLLSLFLGIWVATCALSGWNPFVGLARIIDKYIVNALITPGRAKIILFSVLLGGMVGVISKSGGTQGIVDRLSRYATSAKRGQVASWLMGILIFFDDYANTLIVGSTMRPITDRLRVSREKLAYIVDSTAAPVVSIFPISTWVGFEIGLIAAAFAALDLPMNAYTTFLESIPYRFYQIMALVLGLTIALTGRDFGPMLKAERRARRTGAVLADDAVPLADYATEELKPPEGKPRKARNAFLPIATVIGVTIVGLFVSGSASVSRGDYDSIFPWTRDVLSASDPYASLMWASLTGVLLAIALAVGQRVLSLREGVDAMVEGFKSMILAFTVLLLAWSLGDVCTELRTADYLVAMSEGVISPHWLPVIVFVLAAAVAFATGTSWGVLGILTPLSIPLAHGLALGAGYAIGSPDYRSILLATIASVLAGSVWGDHCSPISDTTILSSMATGSDHIAHVRTQLPYAFAMGLVAVVVGQIPVAFGVSPYLSILLGPVLIVIGVRWLGKPVETTETPSLDTPSA